MALIIFTMQLCLYNNCPDPINNIIMPLSQLPCIYSQHYYIIITIALNLFTILLQQYYNCPKFIHNDITTVLQLP